MGKYMVDRTIPFYNMILRCEEYHSQPWSWKAVLLYVSLGFRLQKTDTFAAYENQYHAAMETLKGIISAGQYHLLELASDD